MKYIIANWKSNKNLDGVDRWLKIVGPKSLDIPSDIILIISPSFLHLSYLKNEIAKFGYRIKLCGQNISAYQEGSHTGEIAASQLADFCDYVMIGHSERRKYFGENNHVICKKIKNALEAKLIPIVGLTDTVNQEGLILENLLYNENNFIKQIEDIKINFYLEEVNKILFMYEPISAISKPIGPIGVGQSASIDSIKNAIKTIRFTAANNMIMYGGSVKSDNVKVYFAHDQLAGVVIGTASLDAEEFIRILLHASQI